ERTFSLPGRFRRPSSIGDLGVCARRQGCRGVGPRNIASEDELALDLSWPHLLPDRLETELSQQLRNPRVALALLDLDLNLPKRWVSERLPCPDKDLRGEAGRVDF